MKSVVDPGPGPGGAEGLRRRSQWWRRWLFEDALPLWAERGLNPRGGFHDRLGADGLPVPGSMRLRVQARQLYVYAEAGRLGWTGDWRTPVEHGLAFLLNRATLASGLVAHAFDAEGAVLDAEPDLYDQAFALFGYAAAWRALGDDRAREAALSLLDALEPVRHEAGGFRELETAAVELRANPQMHLLEAALSWAEAADADKWRPVADSLAELCATRLTHGAVLRERFHGDWSPASDETEPGHHYEWAWLLHRHGAWPEVARALAEHAETTGVDRVRDVAVDLVDASGRTLDPNARLWPQTERIKAALALGAENAAWRDVACRASDALARYLRPELRGAWYDSMTPDGELKDEPAPASSLYHIMCAISELSRTATRS